MEEIGKVGKSDSPRAVRVRSFIARGFGHFEDAVYVGLGVLLAYSAAALLVTGARAAFSSALGGSPVEAIIDLLDRSLLILLIIELLYTVQVSFRSHALMPEPFLVVGLIAATRRILVVTAESSRLVAKGGNGQTGQFRDSMIELAILTMMVVALVASLRLLRGKESKASS